MGFWDVFNSEGQGDDQSSKPIDYKKSVGFSQTHSANNEMYDGSRFPSMEGSSTAQQGAYAASDIGQTLDSEGQGGYLPPQPNYYQESTQQDVARQQMSGVANFIAQVPRVANFITQVPEAANLINQVPGAANFLPFMQELSNVQGGSSAVPTVNSEGQGGSLPPQPIDYGESVGSFKTNSANNESNVQGGPTPQVNYPNFAPMPRGNYQNITAMPEVNYSNFTPTPQVKDYQSIGGVPWGAAQDGFSQGLSNQGNGRETGSRVPLPQVIVVDDDPSQPTNVVIVEDDEGAATTSFNSGDASGGADILGGFSNGQDAGSRLPQQMWYSGDVSQDVVVEYGEPIMDYYEPTWEQGGGVPLGVPMSGWREPAYTGADFYPGDVQVSIGANETYVPQGREPNIGGYMPVTYNNPVY